MRDDNEGTFIYQNENRDGALVTGEYGYIDAFGSLVKVNYQADENGFQQNIEQEKDFLRSGAQTAPVAPPRRVAPRPAPRPVAPRRPAFDQDALIAQIVSALTPQINSAVQATISSTSSAPVRTSAVARPAVVNGDRLTPFFGQ